MIYDVRNPQSGLSDVSALARTGLVRIRHGADTALFGGWGVRI